MGLAAAPDQAAAQPGVRGGALAEPPYLVRGDLLDELPALVEEAQAFGRVVVFHSAVIVYLDEPDRRRFADLMTGLVASGACHWVSNEGLRVLPDVTSTAGDVAPLLGCEFVLGLDGQALAFTHGHGRALHWLGDGDQGSSASPSASRSNTR